MTWYDYGARFYDPALGRWHVIDPAVENGHFDFPPYAYVYNNPLRFLDMFGLDSTEAAALTKAAENAVKWINDNYGSTSSQCNRGVNHAFSELTGSNELEGLDANGMIDKIEKSENFETVEQKDMSTDASDGEIIIAGKKESGGESGHVVLGVPGEEADSGTWKENVPQVMDTVGNKRFSKGNISRSWVTTDKSDIKYYKYTGPRVGTTNNQTYEGGELPGVTIKATSPSIPTFAPISKILNLK